MVNTAPRQSPGFSMLIKNFKIKGNKVVGSNINGNKSYYEISEDGTPFTLNLRGGKQEMKPRRDRDGYLYIDALYKGRFKHLRIHRLVAIMYLPRPKSTKLVVRHLDGDKLNNNPSNLKWGTPKENAEDNVTNGRSRYFNGEKSHLSKLTEKEVSKIRRLNKIGVQKSVIAKKFKTTSANISAITSFKTWKYVGIPHKKEIKPAATKKRSLPIWKEEIEVFFRIKNRVSPNSILVRKVASRIEKMVISPLRRENNRLRKILKTHNPIK